MLWATVKYIKKITFNCRFSCDRLRAVSIACVPLVTCPEAAPLIGALLKHHASCCCSHLSETFIEEANTAWLRYRVSSTFRFIVSSFYYHCWDYCYWQHGGSVGSTVTPKQEVPPFV